MVKLCTGTWQCYGKQQSILQMPLPGNDVLTTDKPHKPEEKTIPIDRKSKAIDDKKTKGIEKKIEDSTRMILGIKKALTTRRYLTEQELI